MKLDYLTDEEIRTRGWAVLVEHLGPTAALRFWMQGNRGFGDYVAWRHEHLGTLTVADWLEKRGKAGKTLRRKSRRPAR